MSGKQSPDNAVAKTQFSAWLRIAGFENELYNERGRIGVEPLPEWSFDELVRGQRERLIKLEPGVQSHLYQREIVACDPPEARDDELSLDETREFIEREIMPYLSDPDPGYILVVAGLPGVGKTYAGVQAAYDWISRPPLTEIDPDTGKEKKVKRQVFYSGSRYEFFNEIYGQAVKQGQDTGKLYQWQPRKHPYGKQNDTCQEADEITLHIKRGHDARDFCNNVCGDYQNRCPFLKQKPGPITYGNHNHITTGITGNYQLIIGDENPMQSFMHEWQIKRTDIPTGVIDSPLGMLYQKLYVLCDGDDYTSGPELIEQLGGATHVMTVCESGDVGAAIMAERGIGWNVGPLNKHVEYARITEGFVHILYREAKAVRDGVTEYNERIYAGKGFLRLMTNRGAQQALVGNATHMIWFDATADESIYGRIFVDDRPVKVIRPVTKIKGKLTQVTGSNYSKTAMVPREGDDKKTQEQQRLATRKLEETKFALGEVHRKHGGTIGLITFKGAIELLELDPEKFVALNFYGNRGSNGMSELGITALAVIGTPRPPDSTVRDYAKMLWLSEMQPFATEMGLVARRYDYIDPTDGRGRAAYATGYADPRMAAIYWQLCDAEIIQSVHRARPIINDIPVYLFTNYPVQGLWVDEIIDLAEFVGMKKEGDAPGVFAFIKARDAALAIADEHGAVTAKLLQDAMGVSRKHSYRLIDSLKSAGWQEVRLKNSNSRQRSKALMPPPTR